MLGALAVFLLGCAAIAGLWNRFFPRVAWQTVADNAAGSGEEMLVVRQHQFQWR